MTTPTKEQIEKVAFNWFLHNADTHKIPKKELKKSI